MNMSGKRSVHRVRGRISAIVALAVSVVGVLGAVAGTSGAGASGAAALPPPVLGQLVNLVPVSGKVLVTEPGQKSALLSAGRQVPVRSVVDVSQGTVQLTAADSDGAPPYSGQFSQGEFQVLQSVSGGGTTQVVLEGTCTKSQAASDEDQATIAKSAHHRHHTIHRFLQITANGKFVIVGANGRAYETGPASWAVDDNCNGTTSVLDHKGRVVASNNAGLNSSQLAPGESDVSNCRPPRGALDYCQEVFSDPQANLGIFNLDLLHRRAKSFKVCLLSKGRNVRCQTGPLKPVKMGSDSEATTLSCTLDKLPRGTYDSRFLVAGEQVGILLPFTTDHTRDPFGTMTVCFASVVTLNS
jgi:hypothetical protein